MLARYLWLLKLQLLFGPMMDQLDEPGAVGQISQIVRTMNVGEECFIGQHVRNSNSFFGTKKHGLCFFFFSDTGNFRWRPGSEKVSYPVSQVTKETGFLCTEQDAYAGIHSAC